MVWDDYDREWKNYQRSFVQLETEVTRAGFDQAEQDVDRERLDQLTAQRAEAEGQVAANQETTDELRRQLDDIELELFSVNQEHQFTKSTYDSRRYEFEVRRRGGVRKARSDRGRKSRNFTTGGPSWAWKSRDSPRIGIECEPRSPPSPHG